MAGLVRCRMAMIEATGVEEAEVYLKHSAKGPGNRLGAQPLH